MDRALTLAFVGGTGKLGRGLGLRLAAAGHRVLLGSRMPERALDTAAALRTRLASAGYPSAALEGMGNAEAVAGAEVAVLTLPFASLDGFLAEHGTLLADRIVVDVVNPLQHVDGRFVLLPVVGGSVGVRIRQAVGRARVVSAFKNAAAAHMLRLGHPVAGDILVASDDREAAAVVGSLIRAIPDLRALDAGPLANGGFLESLTALQLNLNHLHGALTSIRILGIN